MKRLWIPSNDIATMPHCHCAATIPQTRIHIYFIFRIPHSTLYTLHFTFYTLHTTLDTLHSIPYTTLHTTFYTLHFAHNTLHSTLHSTPPQLILYSLHSSPSTRHQHSSTTFILRATLLSFIPTSSPKERPFFPPIS